MKDKGLSAKQRADKLSYSDKDWIRNSQMPLLKELKKMNRRLAKLEKMKVVDTQVVTRVISEKNIDIDRALENMGRGCGLF
jgi:hypothetical protein